jgi:hypothetical protein
MMTEDEALNWYFSNKDLLQANLNQEFIPNSIHKNLLAEFVASFNLIQLELAEMPVQSIEQLSLAMAAKHLKTFYVFYTFGKLVGMKMEQSEVH